MYWGQVNLQTFDTAGTERLMSDNDYYLSADSAWVKADEVLNKLNTVKTQWYLWVLANYNNVAKTCWGIPIVIK